MITIRSLREGFRRCGIAHSVEPVTYPDDHFTDEQLEILLNEPLLAVSVQYDFDVEMRTGLTGDLPNVIDRQLVGGDVSGSEELHIPGLKIVGHSGPELINNPDKPDGADESIKATVEERPEDAEAGEQMQPESGDLTPVPETKPARKPAK